MVQPLRNLFGQWIRSHLQQRVRHDPAQIVWPVRVGRCIGHGIPRRLQRLVRRPTGCGCRRIADGFRVYRAHVRVRLGVRLDACNRARRAFLGAGSALGRSGQRRLPSQEPRRTLCARKRVGLRLGVLAVDRCRTAPVHGVDGGTGSERPADERRFIRRYGGSQQDAAQRLDHAGVACRWRQRLGHGKSAVGGRRRRHQLYGLHRVLPGQRCHLDQRGLRLAGRIRELSVEQRAVWPFGLGRLAHLLRGRLRRHGRFSFAVPPAQRRHDSLLRERCQHERGRLLHGRGQQRQSWVDTGQTQGQPAGDSRFLRIGSGRRGVRGCRHLHGRSPADRDQRERFGLQQSLRDGPGQYQSRGAHGFPGPVDFDPVRVHHGLRRQRPLAGLDHPRRADRHQGLPNHRLRL